MEKVEAPRIIRQVREEAKELQSREERARDLWRRTRNLLEKKTRASELRSPEGIMARLGRGKLIPVLKETFGEGEDRVEVVISPRKSNYVGVYMPYQPNLEKAAILIQVDRSFRLALPPNHLHFGANFPLPESKKLDLLEELMTAIEKQVGAK